MVVGVGTLEEPLGSRMEKSKENGGWCGIEVTRKFYEVA